MRGGGGGDTNLERSRVGDCSVSRGDHQTALTDRPQVGLQSPREELAERGVLVQLQLTLGPGEGSRRKLEDTMQCQCEFYLLHPVAEEKTQRMMNWSG